MVENNFGKGIKITSGFDLSAKFPLDNRYIVKTLEERDAHVTNNRVYEGMTVYVLDEKKVYIYNGTEWTEQTSDLEKIETSNIEPTDEKVSLWINTSEEIPTNVITRINDDTVASNTTWSSEKISNAIGILTGDLDINLDGIHTHDNKEILDQITQENIDTWNSAKGMTDEERQQLENKADKSDIPTKVSQLTNDSGYLTNIPTEYITENELNSKGYLTEHQDISHLALKSEIEELRNEIEQLHKIIEELKNNVSEQPEIIIATIDEATVDNCYTADSEDN